GPLIIKEAIDNEIGEGKTGRLGLLAGLFLGTLVANFSLRYVQSILMNYVGQRVMTDLRMRLFSHLQRMSIAFFDRNPVGRLVTRLTNDVSTLEQVLSQGVVETLTNFFMLFAIVGVLIALDWRLAALMLVLLPPLILIVRFFSIAQRDGFREQRSWLSRINA